jgi:hypothetical protein
MEQPFCNYNIGPVFFAYFKQYAECQEKKLTIEFYYLIQYHTPFIDLDGKLNAVVKWRFKVLKTSTHLYFLKQILSQRLKQLTVEQPIKINFNFTSCEK